MENEKPFYYKLYPITIVLVVQASNFVSFMNKQSDDVNFSIFFVLGLLCFGLGWVASKFLAWKDALTYFLWWLFVCVVITIPVGYNTVSTGIREVRVTLTIAMIVKNAMLFGYAIFGASLSIISKLTSELMDYKYQLEQFQLEKTKAVMTGELEVKNAKLRAKEIIEEAHTELHHIQSERERIENDLKEFIRHEWEILKTLGNDEKKD